MHMFRTHYIKDAYHSKEPVTIAGWAHDIRDLGKLKFVLVRDKTGIMQVLLKTGVVPNEVIEKAKVNREDVVSFTGIVKENKQAPGGFELVPSAFELLNKVERQLPVDPLEVVPSELETRLDYRYVDLRRKKVTAIFNIKSTIAYAFREALMHQHFTEIHTSSITGAATEGGSDVFPIQYFENLAFLVQSPQLYKQLAVIGGFDKVYMTQPVFRAEKHNTTAHLNEVVQMDIEMGFANHLDAMAALEKTVLHMLKSVKEKNASDLETLGVSVDVPLEIPRYSYSKVIEELQKHGEKIKWGDDFSKDQEKKMFEIFKHDLFFIYDWPTAIRAFYSMPMKDDEKTCHAFDLMYKGLEISSGAQRIHIASILEDQLRKRGLDPNNFEFYLNAFRMGAPPHAGWSIGLERFTMKLCNLDNIREATLFPRDRVRVHP